MQKFKLIEKTKKRNPYYINRYDIEYRYLLNEENCNGFKLKTYGTIVQEHRKIEPFIKGKTNDLYNWSIYTDVLKDNKHLTYISGYAMCKYGPHNIDKSIKKAKNWINEEKNVDKLLKNI
jgi:hypothetical protein